jgi:cell division protein FtsB
VKKILPVIIVIVLLVIIRNIVLSIIELRDNDKVLTTLQEEAAQKKTENKFLKEKLLYVKSEDFVETEAREKLGLVKEGEYIVVASPPAEMKPPQAPIEEAPNWKKWWEVFN